MSNRESLDNSKKFSKNFSYSLFEIRIYNREKHKRIMLCLIPVISFSLLHIRMSNRD